MWVLLDTVRTVLLSHCLVRNSESYGIILFLQLASVYSLAGIVKGYFLTYHLLQVGNIVLKRAIKHDRI